MTKSIGSVRSVLFSRFISCECIFVMLGDCIYLFHCWPRCLPRTRGTAIINTIKRMLCHARARAHMDAEHSLGNVKACQASRASPPSRMSPTHMSTHFSGDQCAPPIHPWRRNCGCTEKLELHLLILCRDRSRSFAQRKRGAGRRAVCNSRSAKKEKRTNSWAQLHLDSGRS